MILTLTPEDRALLRIWHITLDSGPEDAAEDDRDSEEESDGPEADE